MSKKIVEEIVKPKPKFSVTERFEFISQFVNLVGSSKLNSFILTGSGGLGKTHAVIEGLKNFVSTFFPLTFCAIAVLKTIVKQLM